MIIYPAILSDSIDEVKKRIELYHKLAGRVHIDLIDDPSLEGRTCTLDEFIITGLLRHSATQLHLMVMDSQSYLSRLDTMSLPSDFTVFVPASQFTIGNHSFRVGASISPDDELGDILLSAEVLQVMTVQPGSQGNTFLSERLIKVDELRTMGYPGPIQVDGGIDEVTIAQVLKRDILPDALCVGHYFQNNTSEHFMKLQRLLSSSSSTF